MDSKKKVCLITGATNGIGRAGAARIAEQGFCVVLVGRDEARGAETVAEVKEKSGNDSVELLLADLSSVKEVQELAARFRAAHDRLDVLVNNAGAIFQTRQTTNEGFEKTFALNHLAYFVLTTELLDMLQASVPARIINVASGAHRSSRIDFDDIHLEQKYSTFSAYGRSKLANILFTRELSRRLEGSKVTANSMHPGFVGSGFARNNGKFAAAVMGLLSPFARTPERGAETLVHLAISAEVEGVSGEYFFNQRPAKTSKEAASDESARRLWEASEKMVEAVKKVSAA